MALVAIDGVAFEAVTTRDFGVVLSALAQHMHDGCVFLVSGRGGVYALSSAHVGKVQAVDSLGESVYGCGDRLRRHTMFEVTVTCAEVVKL